MIDVELVNDDREPRDYDPLLLEVMHITSTKSHQPIIKY